MNNTTSIYQPWNEVTDTEKLEALTASMGADGWIGAPLVADNDQLLTGSHRYVAAGLAGIDAPVVDIRELVEGWDELLDDTGIAHYEVAIGIACSELPHDIKTKYGIDIH